MDAAVRRRRPAAGAVSAPRHRRRAQEQRHRHGLRRRPRRRGADPLADRRAAPPATPCWGRRAGGPPAPVPAVGGRPAGRHHQLPLRPADVGGVSRLRGCRGRRRRRRAPPLPGRDLHRRARGRRLLQRAPIAVSACDDLSRSLIGTGFSYSAQVRAGQARALSQILPRVRDIRRGGSAAIDLAWVACGRLDGYYELGTRRWDRAAGVLLVSEAGGVVSPLAAGGRQRRRGAGGRAGAARGSRPPRGIRAATLNAPSGAACHGARFTRMAPTA